MSKRHILTPLLNSIVAMVFVLSAIPTPAAMSQTELAVPAELSVDAQELQSALPDPSQPPQQTEPIKRLPKAQAPTESALDAFEVIETGEGMDQPAAISAPAVVDSPDACSAPAKIPFGQDLELLMGLSSNHTNYRMDQTPAWGSASEAYHYGTPSYSKTLTLNYSINAEQALICDRRDYQVGDGGCWILTPGQYTTYGQTTNGFGLNNDRLSSIKTGANIEVTLYQDGSYGGGAYVVGSSASIGSLHDYRFTGTSVEIEDHVTSIRVKLVPHTYGNVAAAAWGIDGSAVLLKTGSATGELAHTVMNGGGGWSALTRLGISNTSNPIALVRGMDPAYFVRSGVYIKTIMSNQGQWGTWENIPGIFDAASDPMVVMPDIYHFKLFYRTSGGSVKFTEWESGIGWRTTPLNLGAPAGTTIASDLGAVARDEGQVAVFGVSANNKLWVKTWSSANNKSDWSDVTWVEVASSIKVSKPGVASRSVDHIGVAMLNTSNTVVYKEWTYQTGWKTLATISGYVEPVGLAATAGDEMFLYGVNGAGYMYTNLWTKAAGWAGWILQGSGYVSGQTLAAVVGRPHDLTLFGRKTSNHVVSQRFSNQGKALVATPTANPNYGVLRGQSVATVNGRTAWVSAWRGDEGKWVLAARDTATWYGTHIFLDDPVPSTSTDNVSLTTADIDLDGNDEIILGTLDANGTNMRISVYKLTHTGNTVTQISRVGYRSVNNSVGWRDVQVAVGDLNGDGIRAEMVIGALRKGYAQAYVRAYTSNLGLLKEQTISIGGSAAEDFEMAIGQVDSQAGEHLVLATTAYSSILAMTDIASFKFDPNTASFSQVYTYGYNSTSYISGAYSSALAVGDVDSDGIDEVIHTSGTHLIAVKLGATNTSVAFAPATMSEGARSLAVGDVDGDGRAETVYSSNRTGGMVRILKYVSPGGWLPTGSANVPGLPLLADLDGDTPVATYMGCNEVSDVHVLGVANSQPVWYQNGESVQNSGGGIANSSTATSGSEDGWSTSFGGSFSIGFEHEFSVPVLAIKVGEVRFKTTAAFKGSFGGGTATESSTTESEGVGFGSQAFGIGAVCYTQTSYKCYNYALSKPGTAITTTTQSCVPVPTAGTANQVCSALEDWGSAAFKQAAGSSWTPVGHRPPNTTTISVNLGWANNYPIRSTPPVDPYRVWWQKSTPINVYASSNPGSVTQNWSIEQSSSTTQIKTGSFEESLEISAGATAMDITVDASLSAGFGTEWSSSVGFGEGLEYSGSVYHYPTSCTTPCKSYSVVPYVYKAQARTLAGVTYSYLEQDYYVSALSTVAQADVEQTPQVIVGIAPQAPVVASPTHADPDTWYANDTAVLTWDEPAGEPASDPAVVTGYKWNLTQTPVVTPTYISLMTTTHTYEGLADGVYYLHIQAVGDGGDLSPVTHRAIRVDMNAPQVTLVTDPIAPDGFNDWFKAPLTVNVVTDDLAGSGIATVEYSTNGTTWLPYSAAIPITTDTAGITVWARATDNVGNTSEPVSTTIKLDQVLPSIVDSDGYGISYASIITTDVGNAQLVLGGALNDALSGRLQVEVRAGDADTWHVVSAIGELPIPPGNQFSTTLTSLNWIYTPTFEVRGVYPLWARGVDAAGNVEAAWQIGLFWWEPDSTPVLEESRVSVSPQQARSGEEFRFTVGARNTGYQEARVLVTDTLPAGLTVVEDSISNDGTYNALTRQITWALDVLWQGETRYLFFNATADDTTVPITLENQLDLMTYYPWLNVLGVPAEPAHQYFSTTAILTVLPAGAASPAAPRILDAAVTQGEVVNTQQVTLLVNASPEARYLYVREWVWDYDLGTWALAQESDWLPFETATGFEVSQDANGRYGRYQWTLSQGDGVKYLGVWVADVNGQISNLNEGNLVRTNLVSATGQAVNAGQRVQYRVKLVANAMTVLSLVSLSGDADLYVWQPRTGFMPHFYSNGVSTNPPSLEGLAFYALEEGVYVIEVEAVTDATYRLISTGETAGGSAETSETRMTQAEKERPEHPLDLSTPFALNGADQPLGPAAPVMYIYYMPVIMMDSQ